MSKPAFAQSLPSNITRFNLSKGEIKDLDGFSFLRYTQGLMPGGRLDGIEKEMVEEGEREKIKDESHGGHVLSIKALCAGAGRSFRNDLTAGGSGTGSDVLAREAIRPLIDILFENMPLRAAGATIVTDLRGALPLTSIGRSTARPTEKAETAAATELSPTTEIIELQPRRIPAYVDASYRLLRQSNAEMLLRNYLGRELAARWEAQAINGSGTGDNILGILQTPGIGSVVGGTNGLAPTLAHLVDLEGEVTTANDMGRRYLTNSAVRKKLKKTPKSSGDIYIWGDSLDPALNGYPALVSDLVPGDLTKGSASGVCSAIIHGDFRDLVLAQWGGMQFGIDPFTFDTSGIVRISCSIFVNSVITRVSSFAAMQDALTA